MSDAKGTIETIITAINDAWMQKRTSQLHQYFHENMVIVGPDAATIGKGKKACVQSYQSFVDNANVLDLKTASPSIDVWESTASAVYEFEIIYELNGTRYHEKGKDLFLFTLHQDLNKWLAVWRMVLPTEAVE